MNRTLLSWMLVLMFVIAGCKPPQRTGEVDLAGEWRSKLQFKTGPLATVKDLEFMYVFHAGGTMTESSNYDAAPPVPPAYGIWRKIGPNQYEAKYEFYMTRQSTPAEAGLSGGGWMPAGRGMLLELITLSGDGNSFTSKIRFDVFDATGKPASGGGEATGRAIKLKF